MTTISTQTEKGAAGEEPLGLLLKRAHKAANHLLRRILEPLGLTPVQAAALGHLLRQESLSLGELAERMRSDAPTLSGVVECLVGAGYVERRDDPRDRRRLCLAPTAKARAVEAALRHAEERREAALTARLSPAETAQLKALLKRVRDTIDFSDGAVDPG